jgi:hypothetical protein
MRVQERQREAKTMSDLRDELVVVVASLEH